MRILIGDLSDPRVRELLQVHVSTARANTPACSAHALEENGLQAPGIQFWAAWEGGELVGLGALKRLSADHGEIKSMHVAKARRRTGAGSAILRHIVDAARGHGMSRLSLETGAAEYFRPAKALYAKHGFAECPPYGDYQPDSHSVFMTLALR